VKKLIWVLPLSTSLVWIFLTTASLSQGQTVASDYTPLDFGTVNVCAPSKTPPAGCSVTEALHFSVTAGGTLGEPKVLTVGAPNQDFTLAGNTCTGNVASGASCTVKVTLAPKFPGIREGAVQITDQNGNTLATRLLHGVGLGPQIAFNNAVAIPIGTSVFPSGLSTQIAVDGAGNVYYDDGSLVYEVPASGGPRVTVGAGFDSPWGLSFDGAGNLYVSDWPNDYVVKVPPGCLSTSCQTTLVGGFIHPTFTAMDFADDLFVVDSFFSRIYEMPAGCVKASCTTQIGKTWNNPYAMAPDNAGNLFVADDDGVVKVNISSGQQTAVVVPGITAYGLALDAAGDLYFSDIFNDQILELPAGGGPLITLARPGLQTWGVALDSAGNLFFGTVGPLVLSELRRAQPSTYTFATTPVDTASADSPQPFLVQNIGSAALSLLGLTVDPLKNFVQVAGPGTPADCKIGLSLTPGALCDLSISYIPMSGGPATFSAVMLNNTGSVTSAQVIPLAGIGGPSGPSILFPGGFYPPGNDYSNNLGLIFNGGSNFGDDVLQLTDGGSNESRSAFSSTPIGLEYFQTSFDFQLTGNNSPAPDADGIAFVLQVNAPNALGSSGGGLGYGLPSVTQPGTKITNSVAIKFDLHNNDGEGTSSTGFYLNGAAPTVPSINLLPSGIDLHSGHVFHVVLVYDGSALNLTLTDQLTKASFITRFPANLAALLGSATAYAGFTGATGTQTAVQNILNWQLTSSACCTAGMPTFTNGFTSTSEFAINGDSTVAGGSLLLAPGGGSETNSVYYSTAIPVGKFTSDFDFQLSRGDGEGFTFVLQSAGLHALGSPGGGLGYGPSTPGGAGAKIPNSVAVKLDLFSDAGEGSNSTGVYIVGASPTVPATNVLPSGINLRSGHPFHAHLSYDGANLTVSIIDLSQYAVFTGAYPVNIPAAIGTPTAYAGFTATTGATGELVKILDWNMTSF
jgi:Legume lectin domain